MTWVGIAVAGYARLGHVVVAWMLRRLGVDAAISGLTPAWLSWGRRAGPRAGPPTQRDARAPERGWSLDLPDEP